MEAPDPLVLRQLIKEALEECTDTDLLDLVYQLLITNSTYSGGVLKNEKMKNLDIFLKLC